MARTLCDEEGALRTATMAALAHALATSPSCLLRGEGDAASTWADMETKAALPSEGDHQPLSPSLSFSPSPSPAGPPRTSLSTSADAKDGETLTHTREMSP